MGFVRISSNTFAVWPVEVSPKVEYSEIWIEEEFSTTGIDKAFVLPLEKSIVPIGFFPCVEIIPSPEVESGCVLPESWFEENYALEISEEGYSIVKTDRVIRSSKIYEMLVNADKVILKTEYSVDLSKLKKYFTEKF